MLANETPVCVTIRDCCTAGFDVHLQGSSLSPFPYLHLLCFPPFCLLAFYFLLSVPLCLPSSIRRSVRTKRRQTLCVCSLLPPQEDTKKQRKRIDVYQRLCRGYTFDAKVQKQAKKRESTKRGKEPKRASESANQSSRLELAEVATIEFESHSTSWQTVPNAARSPFL